MNMNKKDILLYVCSAYLMHERDIQTHKTIKTLLPKLKEWKMVRILMDGIFLFQSLASASLKESAYSFTSLHAICRM